MLNTFILLVMVHALCDFPLQPEFMAKGKNRHTPVDFSKIPKGQTPTIIWPYFLSAHSLIHGLGVYLVTGIMWLGVAETLVHWITDYAKCENWTNPHQDQSLHVGAKALWALLA